MKVRIKEQKFDKNSVSVVIDKQAVYVDGEGGQLGDRGTIEGISFSEVTRIDGVPWILLAGQINSPLPELVELDIDQTRRNDIAIQHTGQHLLSAVFQDEFEAKTVGFQMGELFSTIDLALGVRDSGIMALAEALTNKLIRKCLPVNIELIPVEQVGTVNLRKAVSEKILKNTNTIRIVTISDVDRSACGGLHVKNTGEIGLLKIVKTEKVKGDLTRVYFVAGKRALADFDEKTKLIDSLVRNLTCSPSEIFTRVIKISEDLRESRNNVKKLSERLSEILAKTLQGKNNDLMVMEDEASIIASVPRFLSGEKYVFLGKSGNTFTMTTKGFDCRDLFSVIKEGLNVSGGAGHARGQFVSTATLNSVETILKDYLRKGAIK